MKFNNIPSQYLVQWGKLQFNWAKWPVLHCDGENISLQQEIVYKEVYKYNDENPIGYNVMFEGNAQFPTAKVN